MRRLAVLTALMGLAAMGWAQAGQTIRSITVRGNQNISTAAIEAAMLKLQVGKPFSRADVSEDEQRVAAMGWFRDAKILTRESSPTEVEIVVEVVENPVVREFRILGNTVLKTDRIAEIVARSQTIGQVYNLRNARIIRDAITEAYSKEGYFVQLLALEPDQEVPGALLVSVLEPTVGDIKLIGLGRTKTKTIERFMKTKPGQPFSLVQWQRDLEELYVTNWFEKIEPAPPSATDKPGVFNLAVDFTEARTAQIGAGVALDPNSRLVGNLFYSDSNFRGSGQSVSTNVSQATAGGGPSLELGYNNRFYDAKDTTFSAQLFSKVVYNFTGSGADPLGGGGRSSDFSERRTGLGVTFSRPVSKTYRATLGLSAQNINTINKNLGPNTEFIQQDGDLVYLQMAVDYDTRRPSQEPWGGQFIRLLLEPGYSNITRIGGNVATDTQVLGAKSFIRSSLEYRQYWSRPLKPNEPFDKPRPVVAFRARYAQLTGTVPFFEQLFVGGSNSLRGYDAQRFWGNQSFLSSLEYRYPLQKSFNLIAFVDYGGAWGGYGRLRDFTQSSTPKMQLGYGLGAAFRTPLGPIRIDFAFNQNGGNKTHFFFGTSF